MTGVRWLPLPQLATAHHSETQGFGFANIARVRSYA